MIQQTPLWFGLHQPSATSGRNMRLRSVFPAGRTSSVLTLLYRHAYATPLLSTLNAMRRGRVATAWGVKNTVGRWAGRRKTTWRRRWRVPVSPAQSLSARGSLPSTSHLPALRRHAAFCPLSLYASPPSTSLVETTYTTFTPSMVVCRCLLTWLLSACALPYYKLHTMPLPPVS